MKGRHQFRFPIGGGSDIGDRLRKCGDTQVANKCVCVVCGVWCVATSTTGQPRDALCQWKSNVQYVGGK